jgi:hypothetical protein
MYAGFLIMSGQSGYSPWFSRQATSAKFVFEFIQSGGALPDGTSIDDQVTITVFTKKADEAGDGTPYGTTLTLTTDGNSLPYFAELLVTGGSGMEDLVRFKFESPVAMASLDELSRWNCIRALAPVWFEKA